MADDITILNNQRARLRDLWRDFRKYRTEWDKVIRRRDKIELQPEIQAYGEGIDIQSADPEIALNLHVKFLMLNPTKIDANCLETGPEAKEDVEDVRIWTASSYLHDNEDRGLDLARSQAQCQYGVAIERMLWHMPGEGEYTSDPDDKPDEYLKERDSYFRGLSGHPFQTIPVNPLECQWMPLGDPTLFIQESEVPVVDAFDLKNDDGLRVSLDQQGQIAFLADSQPLPEWYDGTDWADRKLKLIIRDYKDPRTGEWWCNEYIENGTGSGDSWVANGAAIPLKKYKNPLGACSFFITPSGDELPLERDPHLRFRPRMYALVVNVSDKNYWMTLLAALARRAVSLGFVYINIGETSQEVSTYLEELGMIEGAGAERRLVFRLPQPGSGELMVSPKLEPIPVEIPSAINQLLKRYDEQIAASMPNRFLSGNATPEEVAQGAATSLIDQRQAAGLPYGADLAKQDVTIRRMSEAKHHAIIEWDEESDAPKRYYITTSSDEPTSMPPLAGQSVYVDTAKLSRKFNLVVKTKGSTRQEDAFEAQQAYNNHEKGTFTDEQLIRGVGFDDPHRQMRELNRDTIRKIYFPRYQGYIEEGVDTIFLALTGLPAQPQQQLQAPQQQPQQAQPQQQGIVPSGGGVVANALASRQGPEGGSSPMAGIGGMG